MKLLKRGLDVLVEKPMAASAVEAEEMAGFAAKNNLVLAVGLAGPEVWRIILRN
jgi:predicted dehydrogenase